MKIILFIFISLLSGQNRAVHQYHLSQCLVSWNENVQSYEVSVFMFIDDLTVALENQGASHILIEKDNIDSTTTEYIHKYLSLHFEITQAEESMPIHFIGEELSDDLKGLWCYFEVPLKSKDTQKLTIRNDLLMDIFSDQKNVVTIKGNNNKEDYFLLKKGDAIRELIF